MNYEEKIQELSERIAILEKAENKRKTKKKIQITLEIIKILVIFTIIFIVYININNKIIKPYKEKIDYVEDKVNSVEKIVQDKWDIIKSYNPFK